MIDVKDIESAVASARIATVDIHGERADRYAVGLAAAVIVSGAIGAAASMVCDRIDAIDVTLSEIRDRLTRGGR